MDASNTPPAPVNLPELLATFYAFVPERGLKFGLFPWPLPLVLAFLIGWLALALLIGVFLPHQLVAIASILPEALELLKSRGEGAEKGSARSE